MNNSPTITAEEQALKSLAEEVKDYQDSKGLSDSALCKKFAELGSTKTYKRILDGDFNEMDVERQTLAYREAIAQIKAEIEAGEIPEPTYDDFPDYITTRQAVVAAMNESGTDRLVMVQGPSGSGKTTIGNLLRKRWSKAIATEADPTWTRSVYVMMADMIRSMNPIERDNSGQIPSDINERKNKILDFFKARKRILIIEEAQHLGIPGLDMVKTLINQTETVIVLLALDTLMNKLERVVAYEQARQLTRNRLKERIKLRMPGKDWVGEFLKRRGVNFVDEKTANTCALNLASDAESYGRWKFVNLVCRQARRDSQGAKMDLEQFIAAQQAVIKTR